MYIYYIKIKSKSDQAICIITYDGSDGKRCIWIPKSIILDQCDLDRFVEVPDWFERKEIPTN